MRLNISGQLEVIHKPKNPDRPEPVIDEAYLAWVREQEWQYRMQLLNREIQELESKNLKKIGRPPTYEPR